MKRNLLFLFGFLLLIIFGYSFYKAEFSSWRKRVHESKSDDFKMKKNINMPVGIYIQYIGPTDFASPSVAIVDRVLFPDEINYEFESDIKNVKQYILPSEKVKLLIEKVRRGISSLVHFDVGNSYFKITMVGNEKNTTRRMDREESRKIFGVMEKELSKKSELYERIHALKRMAEELR